MKELYNNTQEPLFIEVGENGPREDVQTVERNAVTAIVYNPRTEKYLGLRWKQVDWETFITGGIEEGQTAEEAARMEVREETGYKNLKLVKELPRYHAEFFHAPKGVNRFAHFASFLFELENDESDDISSDEQKIHECVWLSRDEIKDFRLPEGHRYLLESLS